MATNQLKGYRGQKMMDDEEDHDHSMESPQEISLASTNHTVDVKYQRFPYCIVWTPIPFLSWILPMLGHVGIATSEGVIHDFAGSNFVSVDDFAFGDPHKYVQLDTQGISAQQWDACIKRADDRYSDETHNLITNNCHSYVAHVLNSAKYDGRTNWNMFGVWKLTVTKSKYVSARYLLRTYMAFLVLLVLYFVFKK